MILPLAADIGVALAFLCLALARVATTTGATPTAAPAPPPTPTQAELIQARFAELTNEVQASVTGLDTRVGVAVLDTSGNSIVAVDSGIPYVLGSVSKLYLMVCYLDDLYQRGRHPGEGDLDLLDPMIRYSDNDTADTVYRRIGGIEGLAGFLVSRGLAPLNAVSDDEWGTLQASPDQVARLYWLLVTGQLLDPESTQLALNLLSRIYDEQAWGVPAGIAPETARIFMKNGWYPEREGWRINTSGAVQTATRTYYVAVFAYPTRTMASGVSLVEDIAARVNAAMIP